MADAVLDVAQELAQGVIQNELFYAVGAYLLASTPPFARYWQAIVRPASPPEQYQVFPDGATSTVTQTATVFPKPTTLTKTSKSTVFKPTTLTDKVYETIPATRTTHHIAIITATVPGTNTDTVTESITKCVSTSHHHHYKTMWTSYGNPDKCYETATLFEHQSFTVSTIYETATGVGSPAHVPRLGGTWDWTNWVLLALLLIALLLQYFRYIFGSSAPVLRRKIKELEKAEAEKEEIFAALKQQIETLTRLRQDEHDKYLDERDKRDESDAALVELGVIKNRGDSIDDGAVAQVLFERQKAKDADANLIRDLTSTNETQSAEIEKLKEGIHKLLHEHYVPGFDRSFDESIKQEQSNRKRLLRDWNNATSNEAIRAREELINDLMDDNVQLRRLPGELSQVTEELETVKKEKKQKGVDDERRWNNERDALRKKHSEDHSQVYADLKQAHSDLRTFAKMERELLKKDETIAELERRVKELEEKLKDREEKCDREKKALRTQITESQLQMDLRLSLDYINKSPEQGGVTKRPEANQTEKRSPRARTKASDEATHTNRTEKSIETAEQPSPSDDSNTAALDDQVVDLTKRLEASQTEKTNLWGRVKTMGEQIMTLEDSIKTKTATTNTDDTETSKKLVALKKDLQARQVREQELISQAAELNKNLGLYQTNEKELMSEVSTLKKGLSSTETAALKKDLQARQAREQELSSEPAQLNKNLGLYQTKEKELMFEVSTLKKSLQDGQARGKGFSNQITTLNRTIDTKTASENDLATQNAQLKSDSNAKETTKQSLLAEQANLTKQRDAAVKERMVVTMELDTVRIEASHTAKELKRVENQLSATVKQLDEAKQFKSMGETTGADLEKCRTELAQMEQMLRDMQSAMESQRNQLLEEGNLEISKRDQQIAELHYQAANADDTQQIQKLQNDVAAAH